MRNVRMTIWVVAAVFLFSASQKACADFILYNNEQLTVNSYHSYGILYDTSQASIVSGGTINSFLNIKDSSTANISGGYVSSLSADNFGTINISGGTVRDLYAEDYSRINISDGIITENFYSREFSTVDISGGSISFFLGVRDSSTVNISGGYVSYLYTDESSTINISGGAVRDLYLNNSSVVTFYGQNFLLGSGLTLDGNRVLGIGILSGKWMNGTLWSVNIIANDPTGTIMAIPEPATLLLFGFGVVMLRKKTKIS